MKELYIFTLKENDKDVKVFLQKPGTQATRKISTVYSVAFSNALKLGIMSEMDIRTHVHDDPEEREKLVRQWKELENKRQMLLVQKKPTEKVDEKLVAVAAKVDKLNEVLNKAVVENSAEVFAYQRVLDWAVTNLTLWEDSRLPVFSGETEDEKMKQYFDALDEGGLVAKIIQLALVCFQGYLMHGVTDMEVFAKVADEFAEEVP